MPSAGAVIVTTPQDVALLDVRKGAAMFRKVDIPVSRLVSDISLADDSFEDSRSGAEHVSLRLSKLRRQARSLWVKHAFQEGVYRPEDGRARTASSRPAHQQAKRCGRSCRTGH